RAGDDTDLGHVERRRVEPQELVVVADEVDLPDLVRAVARQVAASAARAADQRPEGSTVASAGPGGAMAPLALASAQVPRAERPGVGPLRGRARAAEHGEKDECKARADSSHGALESGLVRRWLAA